jgi:hypothetical protein
MLHWYHALLLATVPSGFDVGLPSLQGPAYAAGIMELPHVHACCHRQSAQLRLGGGMLVQVVSSIKPDGWTPTIIKQTKDYLYVEYQSPWLGVSTKAAGPAAVTAATPATSGMRSSSHHPACKTWLWDPAATGAEASRPWPRVAATGGPVVLVMVKLT